MAILTYTKAGKKAYRAEFEFQGERYTKAGFRTKNDAKLWIASEKKQLKDAVRKPETQAPLALMFSAASEMYMEDCRARQQPGTVSEKYRHLTEYAEWLGGDIPMASLPRVETESFISHIQKNATNKTANRYLKNLKAFWNWCARRYAIGESPLAPISPFPEDVKPKYIPPTEDVIRVLAQTVQWQRDFLTVLLKTGARPGEVRTLTWDDVDFSRGTITLWTRKRKGGQREPRTMNMSGQLAEALHARFRDRKNETWVFVSEVTGRPFTRQSPAYKYLMERLCKKADEAAKEIDPKDGIKAFTLSSFRHFVATRLRDSGKANRYEIQHILGHRRSDTTDIYLRSLAPDVKEAVSALDDALTIQQDAAQPAKVIKISRG